MEKGGSYMSSKDRLIQVRVSELDIIMMNDLIADTMKLTGELFNRSELVRVALNEYQLKLEEIKNEREQNTRD